MTSQTLRTRDTWPRASARRQGGELPLPAMEPAERKRRGDASLSLDELYDEFKSLEESKGLDTDDSPEAETCKKEGFTPPF